MCAYCTVDVSITRGRGPAIFGGREGTKGSGVDLNVGSDDALQLEQKCMASLGIAANLHVYKYGTSIFVDHLLPWSSESFGDTESDVGSACPALVARRL